jgi:hypothetical protein
LVTCHLFNLKPFHFWGPVAESIKMYRFLASLVCGAALIAAASSAHAMDYSYRVIGRQIVIDASGEIESDEAARLFNWISAQRWGHRRAYTIVFDSPGGNMSGGVQLASIVAHFQLNTGVAHGGMCASACVMAWSAGARKSTAIDAQIGVHMAAETGSGKVASDGTLFYAQFVKRAGAPDSVVAGLISTPPESVYWLSLAELRQWNTTIVDGADTPLNRAYRPQVATSEPAPSPEPGFDPNAVRWPSRYVTLDKGMLPLLLVSLFLIAASTSSTYLLRRRPTGPNLLNRSGKNDPHRKS